MSETIVLKDGTKTQDRRLDRLESFDEESRQFPISSTLDKKKKERSHTWRCNSWLDQKNEGACCGFGICHELAARPSEVQGLTNDYARTKIYWEAQKIDPWDGGAYPGANPRYEGTSVLAGIKVAQKLGWFDEYRWAFTFKDLILGVGYNGPAVLGIKWYNDMYRPDRNGFITPTGGVAGGHCIIANSVDVKKRIFTLHNSWGKNWGINGECHITFDDMEKLIKDRGEVAFFLKRHTKARV